MKKVGKSAGKIEKWEFVPQLEYIDTQRTKGKLRRTNIPIGGKDYVTCKECGMKFVWLEPHLIQVHNLTKQEYHKKHGAHWKTVCDVFKPMLTNSQVSKSSETNTLS